MTIGAIVGIALVVFGATVLVLVPERPGAKIAWHGLEISSAGAGLPLIFLGLVSVLTTTGTLQILMQPPWSSTPVQVGGVGAQVGRNPLAACFGEILRPIPGDRVWQLESGARDVNLVGPHQSKQDSFAVQLTDGGRPVGLVVFRFFSSNDLFKVEQAIDQECRPGLHRNSSRGGDPDVLQNYDSLRIELNGRVYELALAFGEGQINGNFTRIVL